ncbi:thiolase family protein [Streptantibioticus cattleyicolor]|uniref:Putative thiolase n=1 Tax=Streptantibioticus cattleyicolor (strain ATCC 35852 / DSM 46488 / JCM 4925 / NBRC 14057 / NRRL 8057) TaxID=1003195 RepID=F8JJU8_STREN|nr:thiolase family protein [Streptantibioticus cattleyicolor]AEW98626.1 putative thiolase [Streptantibioticus cattleyicolor NRRL 8057 = DSM 46488]CCB72315.1 putative acetyl-CoA C-acetyltransferase [Streptantibioticus cattleyicolor NRRL 8057 = DSM 46488]
MADALSDERRPVVVAARRTPIGRAGGALAGVEVSTLLAAVIRDALADARADPGLVDDVLVGNAVGGGGNPARLAALEAGLPVEVPGVSVDRQCGSGLEAVVLACRLVAAGAGEVYLAGGGESVSTAPWRVRPPRRPGGLPEFYARPRFAPESVGDPEMGVAAENVAAAYGVSRRRQDEFALRSHRRAVAAWRAGRFAAETTPVDTGRARVTRDECPRPDTSLAALAALPAVFVAGGTVTAGNSCPVNDGAAMVVVTSVAAARRLGHRRGLGFVDAAGAGVDPGMLGIGPVAATRRLRARNPALDPRAVHRVEFNEAFAAQVLASLDALGIDPEHVNLDGGALALGHPYGASGAVLVTRLYSQLVRERADGVPPCGARALAMMGIAGGLGISALFESLAW